MPPQKSTKQGNIEAEDTPKEEELSKRESAKSNATFEAKRAGKEKNVRPCDQPTIQNAETA